MINLRNAYRDFKRLKEIGEAFFHSGLGYYVEELRLKHHLILSKVERKKRHVKPADLPVKLRKSMEHLGGSFVKLGQLLSLRQDLIPKEYCKEFEKLQDSVESFSFVQVKKILKEELKHPIKEIFSEFYEKPIAAASIGQVHKAKLLNGKLVAVKVQRLKIKEKFEADIDLLRHLVDLAKKHIEELRNYDLKSIVDEFEKYTRDEMDYVKEARNISTFYSRFSDDVNVKIPKVYEDYSTRKVLVMEFIDGVPIDSDHELMEMKSDKSILADNLANFFLKQVFEVGVFHADPHPSNVFVLKNNRIALLDYGIVGVLLPDIKERLNNFLISLVERNTGEIVEHFIMMGFLEESNKDLENDLTMFIGEHAGKELNKIYMSHFFNELLNISSRYNFKLPPDFVLLSKAIITIEGVGRDLDPGFNISIILRDYVNKAVGDKFSIKHLFTESFDTLKNIKRAIEVLPGQTTQILDRLNEEKAKTNERDMALLEKEMNRSSDRVVIGVIIAALVISSSLVLQISNYRTISLIGFLIAIVLSIILIYSIISERRMYV